MKKHAELIYNILLIIFTLYVVLDTFVIEKSYQKVEDNNDTISYNTSDSVTTDSTYKDDNISITIKEYYENSTKIYVADVIVNDPSYLKTAFAKSSYGKNITEKTSTIAK